MSVPLSTEIGPNPTPWLKAVACVEISSSGDWTPLGTAFFITQRHALTAWHVVADAVVLQQKIRLRLGPAVHNTLAAQVLFSSEKLDWAILKSEQPHEYSIDLAIAASFPFDWETFGYPRGRQRDGISPSGVVRNLHATDRGVPAIELFSPHFTAGENAHGLSGAPAVDVRSKHAFGILRSCFERIHERTSAGTLYATSIGRVAVELEQMLRACIFTPETEELRRVFVTLLEGERRRRRGSFIRASAFIVVCLSVGLFFADFNEPPPVPPDAGIAEAELIVADAEMIVADASAPDAGVRDSGWRRDAGRKPSDGGCCSYPDAAAPEVVRFRYFCGGPGKPTDPRPTVREKIACKNSAADQIIESAQVHLASLNWVHVTKREFGGDEKVGCTCETAKAEH